MASHKPSRRKRSAVTTRNEDTANEVKSEPVPVEGVRLKTVSMGMMLFAILCLLAFLAGRTEMPTRSMTDSVREGARSPRPRIAKAAIHPLAAIRE